MWLEKHDRAVDDIKHAQQDLQNALVDLAGPDMEHAEQDFQHALQDVEHAMEGLTGHHLDEVIEELGGKSITNLLQADQGKGGLGKAQVLALLRGKKKRQLGETMREDHNEEASEGPNLSLALEELTSAVQEINYGIQFCGKQ